MKGSLKLSHLVVALTISVLTAAPRPTPAATPAFPAPRVDNKLARSAGEETAILAGGCFWGVQSVYEHTKGVKLSISGFAGGKGPASYQQVGTGNTKYAEAVRIVFDPSVISYGQILRLFFAVAHDPTQLNRQGPDLGPQYRSEIFYQNEAQKRIADSYVAQLGESGVFDKPIVTLLSANGSFKIAEAYHQSYATLHPNDPYIVINDAPKVERLRVEFPEFYK